MYGEVKIASAYHRMKNITAVSPKPIQSFSVKTGTYSHFHKLGAKCGISHNILVLVYKPHIAG